jgi:hypothetical protein
MSIRATALMLAAGLVVAGCGATTPANPTASATRSAATTSSAENVPATAVPRVSATSATPPPVAVPAPPGFDPSTANGAMCLVSQNGGTFWLSITSAQAHNFTACGGAPLQADNLDAIFASGPNVDRRCLNSDADIAAEEAVIGVYSSSNAADHAAARDFCTGNGWTNNP